MGRVKKETKTLGQLRKTKNFKVFLIHDQSITRINSSITTKLKSEHRLEDADVDFEIDNTSSGELMEAVWKRFPTIYGQTFTMWMTRSNNPYLISLPPQITTQQQLCSCDELNSSNLYIKPIKRDLDDSSEIDNKNIITSSSLNMDQQAESITLQQTDVSHVTESDVEMKIIVFDDNFSVQSESIIPHGDSNTVQSESNVAHGDNISVQSESTVAHSDNNFIQSEAFIPQIDNNSVQSEVFISQDDNNSVQSEAIEPSDPSSLRMNSSNSTENVENKSTEEYLSSSTPVLEASTANETEMTTVECSSENTCHITSNQSNATSIKIIKQNCFIRGITVVDNKIYVIGLHYGASYIKGYNMICRLRNEISDIDIPDVKSPVSMAGCSHNKALYISDDVRCCIHRFNLSDNSITRWKMLRKSWRIVEEYYEPCGLSVTSEHNVLVTARIHDWGPSGVVEYTSEGQLIREINLDQRIEHAFQTLELSTDQFIISHGSIHGVSVINSEGQIMKQFNGEKGGFAGPSGPRSVSIDYKRQLIFAADRWSSTIAMLHYNLSYLGLFQYDASFKHPTSVYFDLNSDQLMVGTDYGEKCLILISTDQSITESSTPLLEASTANETEILTMEYNTENTNDVQLRKDNNNHCKNKKQEPQNCTTSSVQNSLPMLGSQSSQVDQIQPDQAEQSERNPEQLDESVVSDEEFECGDYTQFDENSRYFWQCLKCKQVLDNAITLPCFDAFCKKCLSVDNCDNVVCPDCKDVCDSTVLSLECAVTRFYSTITRRAVRLYGMEGSFEENTKCDACGSVASRYCMHCVTTLCENCLSSHDLTLKRISNSTPHKIVTVHVKLAQCIASKRDSNLVNSDIATGENSYSSGNEISSPAAQNIDEEFRRLKDELANQEVNIGRGFGVLMNSKNHFKDLQDKITTTAESLIGSIVKWKNDLIEEASTRSNVDRLDIVWDEMAKTEESRARISMFTNTVAKYGSDEEKAGLIGLLHDRLKSLHVPDWSEIDSWSDYKKMCFQRQEKELNRTFQSYQILGRVVPEQEPDFLSSNMPAKTIKQDHYIRGITVVDDKMYVVHDSASYVKVITIPRLEELPDINIPGMKNPKSLTGCSHNKALYISDKGLKCIHRVNLTDNCVMSWNTGGNYEPQGMSVTSEHNVLVVVRNRGIDGGRKVMEYTREGQLIQEIHFDKRFDSISQILELSTDQFIICHNLFDGARDVSIIYSDGQILKRFSTDEPYGRYGPRSLTVDRKRKVIFVADPHKNSVEMLDYDLNFLGSVQSRESLERPTSVYFDVGSDQLMIGAESGDTSSLIIICPDQPITDE